MLGTTSPYNRVNEDDFLIDYYDHTLMVETKGSLHKEASSSTTVEEASVKEVDMFNPTRHL